MRIHLSQEHLKPDCLLLPLLLLKLLNQRPNVVNHPIETRAKRSDLPCRAHFDIQPHVQLLLGRFLHSFLQNGEWKGYPRRNEESNRHENHD
ncbi:hypothetical protein D3C85_1513440 [compost metagenome]